MGGRGILIHGLAEFGLASPEEMIHDVAITIGGGTSAVVWAVEALCAAIIGVVAGAIAVAVLHLKPGTKH